MPIRLLQMYDEQKLQSKSTIRREEEAVLLSLDEEEIDSEETLDLLMRERDISRLKFH